ncbi:MAG: hypothetical protein Q3975_06690, partial [Oscillospiraceae bacterium]|nr:hypothetical protein [Oscillospiraceae bacterium]
FTLLMMVLREMAFPITTFCFVCVNFRSTSFGLRASAHTNAFENGRVIKMDLRDDFLPVEEKTAAILTYCEDF